MTFRRSTNDHSDWVDDLAIGLAREHAAAELDLLGSILPTHARGVAIANQYGVTVHTFSQPDYRIIWSACEVAPPLDQFLLLRLIRRALQAECLWNKSEIAGNVGAMRWSDAALARLATSLPWSAAAVARCARRLLEVDGRLLRAERLQADLLATLRGDAPTPAIYRRAA